MAFLHQACLQRDRNENVALHLLGESTALSYGALDAASLTIAKAKLDSYVGIPW